MNQFDRIIHDMRHKLAQRESKQPDKAKLRFEPPKSVTEAQWQPLHITKSCLFCVHVKSYFAPCIPCKRDQKEAQMRFNLFCKENGVPV